MTILAMETIQENFYYFVGCIVNFIVSYLICTFQDSVPDGSYNDPFLSSVCVCACMRACVRAWVCVCVWNVDFEVQTLECIVWSVECGVWSVECEVWSVSSLSSVWSVWSVWSA